LSAGALGQGLAHSIASVGSTNARIAKPLAKAHGNGRAHPLRGGSRGGGLVLLRKVALGYRGTATIRGGGRRLSLVCLPKKTGDEGAAGDGCACQVRGWSGRDANPFVGGAGGVRSALQPSCK